MAYSVAWKVSVSYISTHIAYIADIAVTDKLQKYRNLKAKQKTKAAAHASAGILQLPSGYTAKTTLAFHRTTHLH